MLQCGPRQPNLRVTVLPVRASKVAKLAEVVALAQISELQKLTEELLMKRLFLMAGLMAMLALAIVASSMAAANFAGTWVLDKSKSQGLTPRMQGADKVTWTITQDDKTISIDQKVEGGQPPAGGGGGAGGRAGADGGRGPTDSTLVFNK